MDRIVADGDRSLWKACLAQATKEALAPHAGRRLDAIGRFLLRLRLREQIERRARELMPTVGKQALF